MGKTDSGMWHEARKQERKIRVMMVDYKRRADRRRQYYERIKQDPTQFLRVYGRPSKVHWESSVAIAAEGPQTTMPWQGDQSIIIDRFDVRSHLDFYQEPTTKTLELTEEQQEEERNANYERYRILVQNEVAGVSEELCLKQIHIDEMYGALENKGADEEKKKLADKKAAIAYTYEDSTEPTDAPKRTTDTAVKDDEPSDESDIEMDLDNTIDIYNLTSDQADMLNKTAHKFGMKGCDYCDNLEEDKNEAEALKMAKIMEEEKAQFSGRRSRRERRAFKEKRLKDRTSSPPSYAARESPKHESLKKGRSRSRSPDLSPDRPGQFLFISSFGEEGSEGVVQGPMLPPHLLPQSVRNKVAPIPTRAKRSRSRSGSRERGGRLSSKATKRLGHLKALRDRASRSRSRSKSSSRSRSRSASRSKSRQRGRSRSRSWSRRRGRYGSSRSRSRSRRRYSRSRSRSRGRASRGRRSKSPSRSRSRSRGRRSRSHRSRSYSRSRSRSRKSYSSSRSRSRSSSSMSISRSRSRSPGKPDVVVKSYRRPSLSSKDSLSEDSGSEENDNRTTYQRDKRMDHLKMLGKKDQTPSKGKLTAAEKMKLKMQKALKKQYKADIQARQEKEVKLTQERQDREDELRALSIQMRRRERERRHRELEEDGGSDTDQSQSPVRRSRRSRSRSRSRRSRSRSPPRRDSRREGDWGSREGRYGGGRDRDRPIERDRDRPIERDRDRYMDRDRPIERDRDRRDRHMDRGRPLDQDYRSRAMDRDHGRGDASDSRRRGEGWERNEWHSRDTRHYRRRSESPRDSRKPKLVDY